MTWMTREEATEAVARDILADPSWTARVVVSAVVAETELSRAARGWPDRDPSIALDILAAALARRTPPDREEPCRLHDIRRCTICNAPLTPPPSGTGSEFHDAVNEERL